MIEIFTNALDMFSSYIGDGLYMIFFLLTLLVVCIFVKDKKRRTFLLGYFILMQIIYWCPISAYIITEFGIGRGVYWRVLWLLPMVLITAWGLTLLIGRMKKFPIKLTGIMLASALLILCGNSMYKNGLFQESPNSYKLPAEVFGICDTILEDAENNLLTNDGNNILVDADDNTLTDGSDNSLTDGGDNSLTDGGDNSLTDGGDNSLMDADDNQSTNASDMHIKAVMPDDLVCHVRQYTSKIHLAYGRDGGKDNHFDTPEDLILYNIMKNPYQDPLTLAEGVRLAGCNYLVLYASDSRNEFMTDYQIIEINRINNYVVYRVE